MRKSVTLTAAAMMLATVPLAAQAAEEEVTASDEATDASKLTPEQLENYRRGVIVIRAFTSAFTADEVSTAVKGRLISCLYNNKLSTISAAAGQVLANSPALDAEKPGDVYRAAAGVCGVVFKKPAPDASEDQKPATTGR